MLPGSKFIASIAIVATLTLMSLDQTVSAFKLETLATVPNPLDTTKLSIQNEYQEQGASVLKGTYRQADKSRPINVLLMCGNGQTTWPPLLIYRSLYSNKPNSLPVGLKAHFSPLLWSKIQVNQDCYMISQECNGDIFSASTLKALRANDITNIKRQFSNVVREMMSHNWFLHQSLAGVCYNAQNVVFTDIRQALSKDTLPKNPVAIDAINMTFFTILSTLYKSPFLPSDPKAVINAENENKDLEIKP